MPQKIGATAGSSHRTTPPWSVGLDEARTVTTGTNAASATATAAAATANLLVLRFPPGCSCVAAIRPGRCPACIAGYLAMRTSTISYEDIHDHWVLQHVPAGYHVPHRPLVDQEPAPIRLRAALLVGWSRGERRTACFGSAAYHARDRGLHGVITSCTLPPEKG